LGSNVVNTQVFCILKLPYRVAGYGRELDVSPWKLPSYIRLIISVTVSIAFGGSQLILAAATLYHEDYVPTAWQTLLVYWASLICSMLINLFFAA
jgi:hypothetical protein